MSDKLRPYFLQRLEKPWNIVAQPRIQKAAKCLEQGSIKPLRQFMDFDLMGSAEFEWGALPEAFREYTQKLKSESVTFQTVTVETLPNQYDEKLEAKLPASKKVDVHIIAPTSIMEDVVEFIEYVAIYNPYLKEEIGFSESVFAEEIAEQKGYARFSKIGGWFDIRNNFFFFTDETMYRQMLAVSRLKPYSAPTPPSNQARERYLDLA